MCVYTKYLFEGVHFPPSLNMNPRQRKLLNISGRIDLWPEKIVHISTGSTMLDKRRAGRRWPCFRFITFHMRVILLDKFMVINPKSSWKNFLFSHQQNKRRMCLHFFICIYNPSQKCLSVCSRKNVSDLLSWIPHWGVLLYDVGYRIGNYVYSSKLFYRIYGNKRVAFYSAIGSHENHFTLSFFSSPATSTRDV